MTQYLFFRRLCLGLVLFGFFSTSLLAAWTPTGSMTTARAGHTATLLPSGAVLLVGGTASNSADLFDPATNSWSAASSPGALSGQSATLLPSGKVLVAGGDSSGNAELYDPATNSWSGTSQMSSARGGHVAMLLSSGKVLVAGGINSVSPYYLASAELYDPATNSWSAAGTMATARYQPTATLLPSGKVLVVGGSAASSLSTAELYDPTTNSWSSAGTMSTARCDHTATLLSSGMVLVAGGADSVQDTSAELYDPATNIWSSAGAMSIARYNHTATSLSSGKVLVAGGSSGGYSAELYDPVTGLWSGAGAMTSGRSAHTATLLPSGQVLVAGGYANGAGGSAELYDPVHNFGFVSLNPTRLIDTRYGMMSSDHLFRGDGPIGAGKSLDLIVAGRGAVPVDGVTAVVLNVTVTNPAAAGYITAWPTGTSRPVSSNLNFVSDQTIANLVIVKLGTGGKVSLYNSSTTNLIVDMAGYFDTSADLVTFTPGRLLDTRAGYSTVDGLFQGGGAIGSGARLNLTIADRYGIPASGVGTVVLNVIAVQPAAAGYLTVWPSDAAQPLASNINFIPGDIIPNLAISKVSASGQVSIYNSAGDTNLVADVAGWFPASSQLTPLVPARLMDTRPGASTIDGQEAGAGALVSDGSVNLTVLNRGGVPASGVRAVVLNVTVTNPSAPGYLTVWPTSETRPLASNLNFIANQTIPNLVIAKVGSNGQVAFYNGSTGTSQVVVDVVGWFAGP